MACDGRGRFEVPGDPRRFVQPWAVMVLDIAERYRKGVPPVAGGSLDQTHWINQAVNFADGERMTYLAEAGAMSLMFG